MNVIHVGASRDYDIVLAKGLFKQAAAQLRARLSFARAVIVSDDRVFPLYGERLQKDLEQSGVPVDIFVIPHGERSKNLIIYADLMESLGGWRCSRGDLLIALGGGVVGDLAGFAAATYRRGMQFAQIPTSLLACVDSSVGGKTAVNLSEGKNQAGCFYQPSLVLIDPELLSTLSAQEFRNGCAEVIKYAVIGDEELFEELEKLPEDTVPEAVIAACVRMKRDIVEKDEFDTDGRQILNFGHTFGHAAEQCSRYAVPHGYAVAMGMAVVTRAAERFRRCPAGSAKRLEELLAKFGLPAEIPYSAEEIMRTAFSDKKILGETIRLVVPEKIGHCVIEEIPLSELEAWLKAGEV